MKQYIGKVLLCARERGNREDPYAVAIALLAMCLIKEHIAMHTHLNFKFKQGLYSRQNASVLKMVCYVGIVKKTDLQCWITVLQ